MGYVVFRHPVYQENSPAPSVTGGTITSSTNPDAYRVAYRYYKVSTGTPEAPISQIAPQYLHHPVAGRPTKIRFPTTEYPEIGYQLVIFIGNDPYVFKPSVAGGGVSSGIDYEIEITAAQIASPTTFFDPVAFWGDLAGFTTGDAVADSLTQAKGYPEFRIQAIADLEAIYFTCPPALKGKVAIQLLDTREYESSLQYSNGCIAGQGGLNFYLSAGATALMRVVILDPDYDVTTFGTEGFKIGFIGIGKANPVEPDNPPPHMSGRYVGNAPALAGVYQNSVWNIDNTNHLNILSDLHLNAFGRYYVIPKGHRQFMGFGTVNQIWFGIDGSFSAEDWADGDRWVNDLIYDTAQGGFLPWFYSGEISTSFSPGAQRVNKSALEPDCWLVSGILIKPAQQFLV